MQMHHNTESENKLKTLYQSLIKQANLFLSKFKKNKTLSEKDVQIMLKEEDGEGDSTLEGKVAFIETIENLIESINQFIHKQFGEIELSAISNDGYKPKTADDIFAALAAMFPHVSDFTSTSINNKQAAAANSSANSGKTSSTQSGEGKQFEFSYKEVWDKKPENSQTAAPGFEGPTRPTPSPFK